MRQKDNLFVLWRAGQSGWGWLLVGLVGLWGLLAACQSPSPAPTPTPTPTAVTIVQQAVARLTDTAGFRFEVGLTGGPAYLDPAGQIAFRTAVGDYAAPNSARAGVRAAAFGLITDVDVISIGPDQWQTNLLTQRWEQLPSGWGFNPGALFDPAAGLPAILTEDMSNAQLVGREKLADGPDEELYVITGQVAGERLAVVSGGLIGPQTVEVTLWIDPEGAEIVRVLVTEPGDPEPSVWQVDFSNYDQQVTITPP